MSHKLWPLVSARISARIANTVKFQRMVAAPSTRLGNTSVLDDDALGRNCIVKIEADEQLDYYERQQGLYARAWDTYAVQMNAKWRDMIFTATAETLEHPADIFLKSSDNWVKLRSIVVAQDKWDRPIINGVALAQHQALCRELSNQRHQRAGIQRNLFAQPANAQLAVLPQRQHDDVLRVSQSQRGQQGPVNLGHCQ